MMRKAYENDVFSIPLRLFSFSDGVLSAFSSDFGSLQDTFDPQTGRTWLQRLYNDACDVGIAIRSHHTGRIERFVLTKEEVRDGDLMAWHFAPVDRNSVAKVRAVIIFND